MLPVTAVPTAVVPDDGVMAVTLSRDEREGPATHG
jgi:hypothetical protein